MRSLLAAIAVLVLLPAVALAAVKPLPPDATFDYQIGGGYKPPKGVKVVSRDWFTSKPAKGAYSICYVNAFQTQADENSVERPDEQSNWPKRLVLTRLGDDPKWGGEYLVDISTKAKRKAAAKWLRQMIKRCDRKGYDAVEFDNLDSWTRFDGTPLAKKVPFGKTQALAYAKLITKYSHKRGLAVAQKNTADITAKQRRRVGFDFAIVEECGRYDECDVFERVYGNKMVVIEYRPQDFERACEFVGDSVSVTLRDRNVSTPAKDSYTFDTC